jgi:hypothetical protein
LFAGVPIPVIWSVESHLEGEEVGAHSPLHRRREEEKGKAEEGWLGRERWTAKWCLWGLARSLVEPALALVYPGLGATMGLKRRTGAPSGVIGVPIRCRSPCSRASAGLADLLRSDTHRNQIREHAGLQIDRLESAATGIRVPSP